MKAAGLTSPETIAYGFPLGRVLENGRNVVARLHGKAGSMEDRTAASGRQYQPPAWTASLTRVVSAPFRVGQRPFAATRLGTGIVARGQHVR